MDKLKIYEVHHKKIDETELVKSKYIQRIWVGSKIKVKENNKYIYHNTGDNIAYKNPYYSELTALYWIMKNDKDSDYIGLAHYRRHYDLKNSNTNKRKLSMIFLSKLLSSRVKLKIATTLGENYNYNRKKNRNNLNYYLYQTLAYYFQYSNIISEQMQMTFKDEIKNVGRKYDDYDGSNIINYTKYKNVIDKVLLSSDFSWEEKYAFLEYFENSYPIEYEVFISDNIIAHYNMFIFNRKVFLEYSNFVFTFITGFENYLKEQKIEVTPRLFGYIGEYIMYPFIKSRNIDHQANTVKFKCNI